jgi:hypothetical protein
MHQQIHLPILAVKHPLGICINIFVMLSLIWMVLCRCEAYSTYPRTYDLLHAWGVLSDIYDHDCSVEDLLLEMDRLLRPYGLVIMRDRGYLIDRVSKQLDALHWNAWSKVLDAEKDEISDADEKILLARKQLWQPEDIL